MSVDAVTSGGGAPGGLPIGPSATLWVVVLAPSHRPCTSGTTALTAIVVTLAPPLLVMLSKLPQAGRLARNWIESFSTPVNACQGTETISVAAASVAGCTAPQNRLGAV